MAFELPPLPYSSDALAPAMSAETLKYHHGKHHNTYVNTLNSLIEGTDFETQSVEEIILNTADDPKHRKLFNQAAQHWNHSFFWNCMSPQGGGEPEGELRRKIDEAFGDFATFKQQFKAAATGQFGSGWAWLVVDDDALKITGTPNAENPIHQNQRPILTCDVWEHAYYIDYRNDRGGFVDAFLNSLINWRFVAERLG